MTNVDGADRARRRFLIAAGIAGVGLAQIPLFWNRSRTKGFRFIVNGPFQWNQTYDFHEKGLVDGIVPLWITFHMWPNFSDAYAASKLEFKSPECNKFSHIRATLSLLNKENAIVAKSTMNSPVPRTPTGNEQGLVPFGSFTLPAKDVPLEMRLNIPLKENAIRHIHQAELTISPFVS